jgi:rRNA maturation protein Nop10
MKPSEEQLPYRVYVLRSWREGGSYSNAPAVWRFSLEDPTTRQRRGFADLAALMSFLAAETEKCPLWTLKNG